MNCLEFRRYVGAEPSSTEATVAAHRDECPACARYQAEMQAMDRLLGKAMLVDLRPPRVADEGPGPAALRAPSSSRRWLAMAASLVAGVLVAATLWVSYPAPTLADEVIGHAAHEPMSWAAAQPLTPEAVADVLDRSGARLRPGAVTVTFAKRCLFEGHWVPHLVVQTEAGPVTVFLLGHRSVEAATRIEEEGYAAMVLPAPRGSIAVVGHNVSGIDAIARQVLEEVEWEA